MGKTCPLDPDPCYRLKKLETSTPDSEMALFPDGRSYQSAQGQSIGDGIFRIPVPSYVKERFWSAKTGIFFFAEAAGALLLPLPKKVGTRNPIKPPSRVTPPPSCLKFEYFFTRVTLGGAVRFFTKNRWRYQKFLVIKRKNIILYFHQLL